MARAGAHGERCCTLLQTEWYLRVCVLYLSHILAGDMYAARYYLSRTILFDGLEPPLDADFSLSFSKGSLAEWKQRLFNGERGEDWENQVRL